MFFLLSKLFWFVAAPSHVLAWLSIATAVFLFLGKKPDRRNGRQLWAQRCL